MATATRKIPQLKQLDIIIACLNDALFLDRLLKTLPLVHFRQVYVADGGSLDNTVEVVKKHGVCLVQCPEKGRARQFNYAANQSSAPYLLFLHADSLPGKHFLKALSTAIEQQLQIASFKLQFDHKHWFLQVSAWCTRFNTPLVRFGDQGLFVARNTFFMAGAYNAELLLLEDQEIFWRLKKHGANQVLPATLITSSRKYLKNGIYRLQAIFFVLWFKYYLGTSQQELWRFYKRYVYQETHDTPEYEKKQSSAAHLYQKSPSGESKNKTGQKHWT